MSDQRPWEDVRQDFKRVAFRQGIEETAQKMHVHRATVYRLLNDDTQCPSGPVRAAVENIVADATTSDGKVDG